MQKTELPYYAVIFTSLKKAEGDGYNQLNERMEKLSSEQKGFLGIHSARRSDGIGITVSYWKTLEDITAWKKNLKHLEAQRLGRADWYSFYEVRICKVEREYSFGSLTHD